MDDVNKKPVPLFVFRILKLVFGDCATDMEHQAHEERKAAMRLRLAASRVNKLIDTEVEHRSQ